MSSGAASQATGGSGRRVNMRGNSSNSRFARELDRAPASSFRGGRMTAAALRRLAG